MKRSFVLCLILFVSVSFSHLSFATSSKITNANTLSQSEQKTVYLTFDDGPSAHTREVLDILSEYNVPATFFVVGSTKHTHLIKDIAAKGHAIGLHCYNHNFKQVYSSQEAYFDDLKKIDDIVFSETGVRSKIIRFPGGSSVKAGTNRKFMDELSAEVQKRGYQYFDWHCDSRDSTGGSASAALSYIKAEAKYAGNNVIVLMHDTRNATVNYLSSVIEYFKEQGFEFNVLTESSPPVHHTW